MATLLAGSSTWIVSKRFRVGRGRVSNCHYLAKYKFPAISFRMTFVIWIPEFRARRICLLPHLTAFRIFRATKKKIYFASTFGQLCCITLRIKRITALLIEYKSGATVHACNAWRSCKQQTNVVNTLANRTKSVHWTVSVCVCVFGQFPSIANDK